MVSFYRLSSLDLRYNLLFPIWHDSLHHVLQGLAPRRKLISRHVCIDPAEKNTSMCASPPAKMACEMSTV